MTTQRVGGHAVCHTLHTKTGSESHTQHDQKEMATTPKGVSVMKYENKQWIYQQQPTNRIGPEHYRLETHPLDAVVANNEVIVEMKYISVDPYMRIAQASRDNWEKPHPLNTLQGSGTIGQIIVTSHPNFAVGDWVLGYLGWQKYCKCYGDTLTKIDPIVPVTTSLGVLGMPGRTAWFGLMEAGRPR
jgi:NADPH-dependent curcumin reductase CurA